MNRFIFLITALILSLSLLGQEKIKYRKLEYSDFKKEFGTNDTALAVIDIFFDKKENAAYGQMSFFPITAGITLIPNMRGIGIITSAITLPIFVHGCYTLVRYRKKKLHKTLVVYHKNYELPKWIRKKVNKQLAFYEEIERVY